MTARPIEHRTIVDLPFDEVTQTLSAHNDAIFHDATTAATRRVTELINLGATPDPFPGFDATEPVTIVVIDPTIDAGYHAFVDFTWSGDPHKRLLANASARLELHPNPRRLGTTELVLHATYQPTSNEPWLGRHHPRGRRILSEALQHFLTEASAAITRRHMPPSTATETSTPTSTSADSHKPTRTIGQFSRILVAVHNPETTAPAALQDALALAERNDATLSLLGLLHAPHRAQRHLRHPTRNDRISELVAAEATARIDAWTDIGDDANVDVHVTVGNPVHSVLDHITTHRNDLLIIADTPDPATAALTRQLIRTCPIPVWVFRRPAGIGATLAAIDPADDPELNRTILQLAQSHAHRRSADLHIAHAWQLHGEALLTGCEYINIPRAFITQLANRCEHAHRAALEHTITDAALEPHQLHLINASPTRAITGLINLHRIDLLVMGSHGRTGIAGATVGNTAEQLLTDCSCSLLVLKPPGFHGPAQEPTLTAAEPHKPNTAHG